MYLSNTNKQQAFVFPPHWPFWHLQKSLRRFLGYCSFLQNPYRCKAPLHKSLGWTNRDLNSRKTMIIFNRYGKEGFRENKLWSQNKIRYKKTKKLLWHKSSIRCFCVYQETDVVRRSPLEGPTPSRALWPHLYESLSAVRLLFPGR